MNLHYRTALALTLVLAIFLASLGLTVSAQAQTSSASSGIEYDHFLIYQALDGDTICREATLLEKRELEQITPKNLRQINHTETNLNANAVIDSQTQMKSQSDNAEGSLTIILRATANLDKPENSPAKSAFLRAAATWEGVINSPVTIYIDADYGPDNFGQTWSSGVLGATSSPSLSNVGFSTVRNNLINGANTPAKQAVYQALPTNTIPIESSSGSSTATTVTVSSSIGRAIGLLNPTAQPTDNAARIGFNSSFNFDFDPSDGITTGQTDFEAVATHEIGHALGFTSRSGSGSSTPAMWDLYRFRSGTTDTSFTTAQRIMTIGGPTPNSQYYFVPGQTEIGLSDGGPSGSTDNNADGNQSSHWRQASRNGGVFAGYIGIMDPRIPSGIRRVITANDTKALDIFGYNSTIAGPPPAPANDNFSAAETITGCAGTTSGGTNVGATHESGEPNHAPDNNGGSRSIWYQWTAPATGQAQISTAGSSFDTVLGVYTGATVSSLTPIGKNDDVDPGVTLSSSVQFTASAGTTYSIAVDGYNNNGSGGDIGSVTLNWALACSSSWEPIMLNPGQVQLKSWTVNGQTSVYAKLQFLDAGYRVASWGTPFQTGGNSFAANTITERWTGFSAQVLTSTAQIYDLGSLPVGDYSFTLQTSGTTVSTINFSVTGLPPPPNPIDGAREFVRWQYKDFLGREPDGPGWDHWTNEITQCSDSTKRLPGESEAGCVSRKRANTSAAFFLSPEFQNTGYFVLRVYLGSLGRMPHFGGDTTTRSEFTRDVATVSNGIVVNNQLSPSMINSNKQAFVNDFVNRSEFRAIYEVLDDTQYVDRLFQTTGVTPSASDRSALIAEAGTAGGRAQVLFKVVDGTTTINNEGHLRFDTTYGKAFYDNKFNAAFVQMEYFGYLLRDPDDNGYAFWLNKMNLFGNWIDAQMVLAFMTSPEYRARFGAP